MNATDFPVSLADAKSNRTEQSSLAAVHAVIVGPTLRVATAAVRAAMDDDERGSAKRSLPGFIPAGLFAQRSKDAWQGAAGLLVADFDNVPDLDRLRARLADDACVALVFTSPSGRGVKAVLRVPVDSPDPVLHLRSFRAAERWAQDQHGALLDPSGKDPSRLCFLCHDPGAQLNPMAQPLDLDRWAPIACAPRPEPRQTQRAVNNVVERARGYLDRMPPSIAGQHGHDALFRAAVVLVWGFALSDAEATPLLDDYNQRAVPQWKTADLSRKLSEAGNSQHREPRGWLLNEKQPAEPVRITPPNEGPDGTEAALAEFLAGTDLNTRLRWGSTQATARWVLWSGTHWQAAEEKIPLPLQVAIRSALTTGLEGRRIDGRGITRLESATAMRGIGTLLSAWPSIRLPEEVDPPGLLATPAGVIDLQTGEPMQHDPARPITRCCPVDPGPTCELWELIEGHLRGCLGTLYPAVHRLLGSALLGLGADRKLLWLHGPGGDGKSTLAKILRCALGDHACVVPAEVFGAEGGRSAHLHELAAGMAGARLAIGLEVSAHLDWPKLKGLSGSDEQRTKHLHGRAFSYGSPPVLMLVSNDKPIPPDRASAERLIVAALQPPADPDERIMAALKSPGLECNRLAGACLSWLLEGCADFKANGIGPVPLCSHESAGLALWWQNSVECGRIVAGEGWATLAEIRADLLPYDPAAEQPHDRELAAFLRTVVKYKRFSNGRRYALTVTHGDASKPSLSHAYRETVSMRHDASLVGAEMIQ